MSRGRYEAVAGEIRKKVINGLKEDSRCSASQGCSQILQVGTEVSNNEDKESQ
jgi:hypothetical protein